MTSCAAANALEPFSALFVGRAVASLSNWMLHNRVDTWSVEVGFRRRCVRAIPLDGVGRHCES
jgi:hypothetical protein